MKRLWDTVIAALAFFVGATALGWGSDLPAYNVEKYCKQLADIYGKDATMLQVCLEDEQKSYDKLKKKWPTLDIAVKNYCQQDQLGPDASSSYYKLIVCIHRELKEDEELNDFKFRR